MALSPSDPSSASSNLLLLLCAEDADDVASWEPQDPDPHPIVSTPPSPSPFDGDEWRAPSPGPDDRHVSVMLTAEPHHSPRPDYLSRLRDRSLDATSRHDAVNWILKVSELFRFRPVTPCLAVSYLDRFLSSRALPVGGEGWATELVSVASVWVAAKMEETQVPGVVELQMAEGPRRVFEPRTVRRMELLLMSALSWRMRSPTPFDFLPHFAPRPLLLPRASSLVLNAHRVVDFLGYRASEIAASAVLCAAREVADSSPGCDCDELATSFAKWGLSKDVVRGCRQLMEEYLIDTCPSAHRRLKPIPEPEPEPTPPPSPVGVLDAAAAACGSCDTQKSSPSAAPPPPPPFPEGEPEAARDEPPPPKRRRLAESRCTARVDTGEDGSCS